MNNNPYYAASNDSVVREATRYTACLLSALYRPSGNCRGGLVGRKTILSPALWLPLGIGTIVCVILRLRVCPGQSGPWAVLALALAQRARRFDDGADSGAIRQRLLTMGGQIVAESAVISAIIVAVASGTYAWMSSKDFAISGKMLFLGSHRVDRRRPDRDVRSFGHGFGLVWPLWRVSPSSPASSSTTCRISSGATDPKTPSSRRSACTWTSWNIFWYVLQNPAQRQRRQVAAATNRHL